MEKLKDLLFSTRLTGILFIVFSIAMGVATFIENDYGTQASKALIYNTKWFEFIMIFFVINFVGNIFRYRLYRKEKWSVLIFHLAFILILVGAGITRYISYEGMMAIAEGEVVDDLATEKTYFTTHVDNNQVQKVFEKDYLFTPNIGSETRFIPLASRFLNFVRGGNDFSIDTDFKGKKVAIDYVNYTRNAVEEFQEDESSEIDFLHFVESSGNKRHDHYIQRGQVSNIHGVLVAFNNETSGAVNIIAKGTNFFIKPPLDGDFIVMATQKRGEVKKDSLQPFNLRALYTMGKMQFVIPTFPVKGNLVVTSSKDKEENPNDLVEVDVSVDDEKKRVKVYGRQYARGAFEIFTLNGLNFRMSYGAKYVKTPFSIKLRDFQLERYPGSNSPKSFASEVTVIDKDETFDFRIFMNNILDYKGFRFFQSDYDNSSEVEVTYLSVNHDFWGTTISYIGYVLLYFAMTFLLFSKKTRFADLKRMLDRVKKKKEALTVALLLISFAGFSQHSHLTEAQIDSVLKHTKVSDAHAEKFSRLVIQDEGGRMKPVHTFASELLRKVSKKDNYRGYDASHVVVSMATNPRIWFNAPIIYMNLANTRARETLGVPLDKKYLSLTDLLTPRGDYKLKEDLEKAFKKNKKNKYEQSIVSVHERASLLYGVIFGDIFRFFPLQNDANNKWFSYPERQKFFKGGSKDTLNASYLMPVYAESVLKAAKTKDFSKANNYVDMIQKYQKKFGTEVMPSERKIDLEIFYNKYDIFRNLFWQYMLAGVVMLIFLIIQIFNSGKILEALVKILAAIVILLFVYHTIGLGIRWYISGHVPWSNGYESMIYVAWATMFFGLAFGRKSKMTIAATTFVVSMILFYAHLNWMDPAIGNLVPVLDSYWVMIHVSIIVASYGPFTLCMVLGLISLLLISLTNSKNKKKLDLQLKEITIINEMSMTVGLVMLVIGNFLGAMWANESWGRYWGWDPKETWALVSIMIYAFVLHMRLIPGLRGNYTFNVWAFFSFASILMTYLGVNHLLSGLHSYAAGEAAPIPYQLWTWLGIGILLSLIARFKYKKYYKKSK